MWKKSVILFWTSIQIWINDKWSHLYGVRSVS